MKVLLFVQSGDARPTVRWTGASARRVAACYARDEARNAAHPDHADKVPPYWLVECENAEDGRALIASGFASMRSVPARETRYGPVPTGVAREARILASGGRR